MARPDFAFRTSTHTFMAGATPGAYVAAPGGEQVFFSLEKQRIPPALTSPQLERAATAWVVARGGRELNLNGNRRQIGPTALDRPAPGPVKRVVSIAPSNAEIMGALEAIELLVGVESSSDFPPVVKSLPQLGPDLAVDMEALAALRPDLVLASLTVPGMERNITALEQLGLPYLVLAPQGLAEIGENISRVGEALGRGEAAGQVVSAMEKRAAAFRHARGRGEPRRVYLEWWPKPMFSPGQACWSNELIELAGGVNVFRHLAGQSAEVSIAQVVAADPEVVFVCWCGVPEDRLEPRRVLSRAGLAGVKAVRNRRVYPVNEDLLGRPGPRTLQGVARMAELLEAL